MRTLSNRRSMAVSMTFLKTRSTSSTEARPDAVVSKTPSSDASVTSIQTRRTGAYRRYVAGASGVGLRVWCEGNKKGSEEPLSLTFANAPQKHAYIDCDSGCRLTFIINKLHTWV